MSNKKIVLSIVGLISFAMIGHAQKPGTTVFGVKGGVNINSILTTYKNRSSSAGSNDKTHIGFHAGVYSDIPITSMIHFQPELLFSQFGQSLSKFYNLNTGDQNGTDFRHTRNYIALPLMVKVYPIEKLQNIYAEVGPEIQYTLGYREKGVYNDGEAFTRKGYKGRLTTVSAGLNIGLGFHTPVKGLTANFRYHAGLTNTQGDIPDKIKEINRSAQIGVLYQLNY